MNEFLPPWEGIAIEIPPDLTDTKKILGAGDLDWQVQKLPIKSSSGAEALNKFALERDMDKTIFDIVGEQYYPIQNEEAMVRLQDLCIEGNLTLKRVGMFRDGRVVWAMAQMLHSFAIAEDEVQGFVFMAHPHQYKFSTSFFLMPMRVANMSTFTIPLLSGKIKHGGNREDFEVNGYKHSCKEIYEEVKIKWKEFETRAVALSNLLVTEQEVRNFAVDILYGKNKDKTVLKENAQKVYDCFKRSPGSTLRAAEGTAWGAFQAMCYTIDHNMGTDPGFSLESAWLGPRSVWKKNAFEYFKV
jgi:hypothetical protein